MPPQQKGARYEIDQNGNGKRNGMKRAELKRWLKQHGATFTEGGKHTKVYCNGKQTVLSRNKEIVQGTAEAICKQLGIGKPPSK